jgi:glycosyltransferase involved in cell wall biosynthesis
MSNGILVDPDSDEIAEALRLLCADKQLRDRLGRKGQELANRKTPHSILYPKPQY